MIQLSSPTRVTPPSCTVPRLKVQNWKMVLRSPMTSSVGSPAYFLSCGAQPKAVCDEMRLSRPIVVGPSMTQWAPIVVPSPTRTPAPMTAYGPTVDRRRQLGGGVDDGCRVNRRHGLQAILRIVHISSASTAVSPSTLARVLYL